MKQLLRAAVPRPIRPFVRRVYRRLHPAPAAAAPPPPVLPRDQCEALTALKCIVSYNRYGGYCVPESSCDRPAARAILANKVYEPETIEFLAARCGDGDIVHAGTYFGDFLPALSAACAPGATVWAFEPNRESFRCARITIEINDLRNVILTNAALGVERGALPFQTTDESGRSLGGCSHVTSDERNPAADADNVPVVPVDDVVARDRRVSMIQLDVEGSEEPALRGAMGTITRCRPFIVVETLPGSTLIEGEWFREHLLELGYRSAGAVSGNAAFACEPRGPDERDGEPRP